jgi:hypothetical protein
MHLEQASASALRIKVSIGSKAWQLMYAQEHYTAFRIRTVAVVRIENPGVSDCTSI